MILYGYMNVDYPKNRGLIIYEGLQGIKTEVTEYPIGPKAVYNYKD